MNKPALLRALALSQCSTHSLFIHIDFIALVVYNNTCGFFKNSNAPGGSNTYRGFLSAAAFDFRSAVIYDIIFVIKSYCFLRSLHRLFPRTQNYFKKAVPVFQTGVLYRDSQRGNARSAMGGYNGRI